VRISGGTAKNHPILDLTLAKILLYFLVGRRVSAKRVSIRVVTFRLSGPAIDSE